MIYIASDHGGFVLKEYLVKKLLAQKKELTDLGPKKLQPNDDYPDYASVVAQKVSANPENIGILVCRSGQGVCIVANKFKNVRAVLVWNERQAKISRNDDMGNVLCLPSDFISPSLAFKLVTLWLATPYSKDARHKRRVKKIAALES